MTLLALPLSTRRPLLVASAAAALADLALWGVARTTGADLVIDRSGTAVPVPAGAVVLATLLGGLATAGLARVAARTPGPRRTYLSLCGAGLVLSTAPPLLSSTTTGTALWLVAMHAVAAALLVPAGLPHRRAAGPA